MPLKTALAAFETIVEPFRMIFTALISRRFRSLRDTGKTNDEEEVEVPVDPSSSGKEGSSSSMLISEQGEEGQSVSGLLTFSSRLQIESGASQFVGDAQSISFAAKHIQTLIISSSHLIIDS